MIQKRMTVLSVASLMVAIDLHVVPQSGQGQSHSTESPFIKL